MTLLSFQCSWKKLEHLVHLFVKCLVYRWWASGNGFQPLLWAHSKYCFTTSGITFYRSRGHSGETWTVICTIPQVCFCKNTRWLFLSQICPLFCLEPFLLSILLAVVKVKSIQFVTFWPHGGFLRYNFLESFFPVKTERTVFYFCQAGHWVEMSPMVHMRLADDDSDDVYKAGLPGAPAASTWHSELIRH